MELNNLITALIVLILGIISRKYIEPNMPEQKKILLYIKKLFSFFFEYVLAIIVLILEVIYADFDKFFVLAVCILFSHLCLQLTLYWVSSSNKTHFKVHNLKIETIQRMALEIAELKKELKNVRQQ